MTAELPGLLEGLELVRKDFPILGRELSGGHPLVYLDSANTSQKPQVVIDAMVEHLERHNANVARAVHQLGAESTAAFEGARDVVADFIGAPSRDEVIFTKNASEALNLVANTFAWARGDLEIGEGDEIVITEMEHHSNIVPWQLLAERKGATLRWFGLTDDGRLDLGNIDELINERTKIVSLTWVSNALGTINPVKEIAAKAHAVGAVVVVDASQAAPQMPVDVQEVDVDFLAFTGHKVVGPTGIGVLWGKRELLEALPPFLGGGEMIETVTMARSTYAGPPAQVRGRHPADRRGGRPGGCAPLPHRHRPGEDPQPTRRPSPATCSRDCSRSAGSPSSGRRTPTCAVVRCPSRSTGSTPTTSARCSTRWGSRSGRDTTARSRLTRDSACSPRPAPRPTSTTPPRRSTP